MYGIRVKYNYLVNAMLWFYKMFLIAKCKITIKNDRLCLFFTGLMIIANGVLMLVVLKESPDSSVGKEKKKEAKSKLSECLVKVFLVKLCHVTKYRRKNPPYM